MSNGNTQLAKSIRYLYDTYGSFVNEEFGGEYELTDAEVTRMQGMYGDDIIDFKNDFERTFLKPKGLDVNNSFFNIALGTVDDTEEESIDIQSVHDTILGLNEESKGIEFETTDPDTGDKTTIKTEDREKWKSLTFGKKITQLNAAYNAFGLRFERNEESGDRELLMINRDGEKIDIDELVHSDNRQGLVDIINDQIKDIPQDELQNKLIEAQKQRVERIKGYNDFREANAPTKEELQGIDDLFSDKSVFDRVEKKVQSLGGDPTMGTISKTVFTDPYSEYIEQTKKRHPDLIVNSDEFYEKALEYARFGEKQKLEANKIKLALNEGWFSDDEERQAILGLGEKEKYNSAEAQDLQADYDALRVQVNDIESSQELGDVLQFQENIENPDFVFPTAKEGDKTLTIGDKQVPASIFQEYLYKSHIVRKKSNALSEAQKNIGDRIETITDSNDQWDLLRRDYNDGRKFLNTIVTGVSGFGSTGTNWLARQGYKALVPDKPWDIQKNASYHGGNIEEEKIWTEEEKATYNKNRTEWLEYFNKNDEDVKIWQNKQRERFQEDIEFGVGEFSAFSWKNPELFGKFFKQEVATQAPIIAMASLGYAGTPLMFLSMAGDRRAEFEYEELMTGKQYSEDYKTLWSAAHAAVDVGTEALTTIPLLNRTKNMMSTGNYSKRGLFNTMKQFYKEQSIARSFVYAPALEAGGEGMATFMQNWIDGRPLMENMGHSLFSGGMFGGLFGGSAYFAGRYNAYFSDHNQHANVRKAIKEIDDLKLAKLNLSRDSKGRFAKVGSTSTQMKEYDRLIKEKEASLEKLIKDANNGLQLEKKAAKAFNDATMDQERIKNKVKELKKKGYSKDLEARVIAEYQKQWNELQAMRDRFKNPNAWGNKFVLLENSDKERYDRIYNKAKDDLGTAATDEQIEKRAEHIFYLEEVKLDVENKKNIAKNLGMKLDTKLFEKGKEGDAIKQLEKLFEEGKLHKDITKSELNAVFKRVKEGEQNGIELELADGTSLNWVFHENAANNGKRRTGTHEIGHSIFYKALGTMNKKAFYPMANQIMTYLKRYSPDVYERINVNAGRTTENIITKDGKIVPIEALDPREVVSEFLEEIGTGQFKFTENDSGFAGLFGFMINDTFSKITNKEIDMDWKNSNHVIAYLNGIGKKIADGTITKKDISALKDLKEPPAKDGKKISASISGSETTQDVPTKDDFAKVRAKVDKYMPKDKNGNFIWNDEIANDVLGKIINDGTLTPFILGANLERVPYGVDPKEFLQDAHVELISTFRRFDPNYLPKDATSLFGWVMGELGYRIGDIYVAKKKKERIKTVSTEQAKEIAEAEQSLVEEVLKETREFAKDLNIDSSTIKHIEKSLFDSLSLFDQKLTADLGNLNKTKKEFIRYVLRDLSKKGSPAVKAISKQFGTKQVLKDYLKKNKSKILSRASKTYLMNNFPQVIQKSVGGKWKVDENGKPVTREVVRNGKLYKVKIFEPNFVPYDQWKGKKINEIDSVKMADTGISSNLKYSIVDNNAVKQMTDTEFLSRFFKDPTDVSTWMQNAKEGAAVMVTQEIGMEMLKDDVITYNKLIQALETEQNPIARKEIKKAIEKTLMHRFKDTREVQDMMVEEGFQNEIVRQTDRGGMSRISNSYSKLTDKQQKEFDSKIDNVVDKLDEGRNVGQALLDVYSEDFPQINGIMKEIDKLRKTWTNVNARYKAVGLKFRTLDKFLIDSLQEMTTPQALTSFMNSKVSVASLGDPINSDAIKAYREAQAEYAKELAWDEVKKEYTDEKIAESLKIQLKYHKSHNTTAAKIGRGLDPNTLDYYKNNKQYRMKDGVYQRMSTKGNKLREVLKRNNAEEIRNLGGIKEINKEIEKSWKKAEPRYQYLAGVKDWVDNVLMEIPGVEITPLKYKDANGKMVKGNGALTQTKDGKWKINPEKITINGKTGREVNGKMVPWVSKKDIQNAHGTVATGRKVDHQVSKDEAQKHWNEMLNYLGWVSENFNEEQMAMTLSALGSHPNAMGRMAARVQWRVKGIENFKNDQLRYEHRPPWKFTAITLADHFMNKDTKINDAALKKLFDSYVVAIIPKTMDTIISKRFKDSMGKSFELGDNAVAMYYDSEFYGREDWHAIENIDPKAEEKMMGELFEDPEVNAKEYSRISNSYSINAGKLNDWNAAMNNVNKPRKGISVIDFDDTLATSDSMVIVNLPAQVVGGKQYGYETVDEGKVKMTSDSQIKITPAEFAQNAEAFEDIGATFDFSEFNKVIKGKKGPFFNKAKALKEKFGNTDIFILTARPAEASKAIAKFLRGVGLDIKEENIVGLEDGRPEAKADWITEKAAKEGYNDFLFADDQIKNIKAVKKALDLLDVKGKLYQARVEISNSYTPKTLDTILDENNPDSPVVGKKKLTGEEAKYFGKPKPWYKRILNLRDKTNLIFVPPSAEDLRGLWNNHVAGKGKKGEADIAWFEEAIIRPYARGERASDAAKLLMLNELDKLYKAFGKDFRKNLTKDYSGIYTMQDTIRMYVWNQLGYDIPGPKKDINTAIAKLKKDANVKNFADQLLQNVYSNKGLKNQVNYSKPNRAWKEGGIDNDVLNAMLDARKTFYKEFLNNKKNIFNKENLNKIEAIYGTEFRKAMEDMFFRMESGVNRNAKDLNNFWLKWLNAGVGNIMFVNIRSALLQGTSFTNFIDIVGDNNPMAAIARFADFKTFKKDVNMLWNSPFLKARRKRGKTDIAMNEILENVDNAKDFFWKFSQKLQTFGYKPTQIMDSFAIAFGGASFYRNRYNTYVEQGKSKSEAHNTAMRDWRERAEETQQSARADLISAQQASVAGRIFLSFQNVTMQYTRIGKKLLIDLKNKRRVKKPGGWYHDLNTSRAIQAGRLGMYLGYQHLLFQGLQQAILALMWNEDDEKPVSVNKKVDYLNGAIDAIMRGMGILGGVLSVVKNIGLEIYRGDTYRSQRTILDVSPAAKSKYTKAQKIIRGIEKGKYSDVLIEGPSFVYGLPTDRVIKLIDQVGYGFDLYGQDYEKYQRIMMLLGWNHWNFYDYAPQGGIVNQMENWGGSLVGEKYVPSNKFQNPKFDKLRKKAEEMRKKRKK